MILIFLTLGSWLSLQNNNTKSIKYDILGSSYENTEIEFTIPGFYLDTVQINGQEYSKITISGVVNRLKKGYPALPRIAESVIIPDDKEIKFRIIEEDVQRVKAPPVIPSSTHLAPTTVPSFSQSE